jgi:hypothetical protein
MLVIEAALTALVDAQRKAICPLPHGVPKATQIGPVHIALLYGFVVLGGCQPTVPRIAGVGECRKPICVALGTP